MTDPDQRSKNDSNNLDEAKLASKQIGWALVSIFFALLSIGFLVWFLHYGHGHIRVPIGAILFGLVGGICWLVIGVKRLILAFGGRGIAVASVLAVLSVAGCVWLVDELAYKDAEKYLPVDGFIDSEKVTAYAASHTWSPHHRDLDEAVWKLVKDHNFQANYMRYYLEFPEPRAHQSDVDQLKDKVLTKIKEDPDVQNCRWYQDAFKPSPVVRDLLITAVSKNSSFNSMTPPPAVLKELAKLSKLTYSYESNKSNVECGSVAQNTLQTWLFGFNLPDPSLVEKGGNLRVKFDWRPGAGISSGNNITGPSRVVEVTIGIFIGDDSSSPVWVGKGVYETPKDLDQCTYEARKDMLMSCTVFESDSAETTIDKATMQQFILARPFRYWDEPSYELKPSID